MSMDPTKWVPFSKLSQRTQERVETVYPYLKLEQILFQDKHSGVFMKAVNNVKIEKLLDPQSSTSPPATATAPAEAPAKKTASSGVRSKK